MRSVSGLELRAVGAAAAHQTSNESVLILFLGPARGGRGGPRGGGGRGAPRGRGGYALF